MTTSDVLGTGWFAADVANVTPGATVAVVGDGYRAMDERRAIKALLRP